MICRRRITGYYFKVKTVRDRRQRRTNRFCNNEQKMELQLPGRNVQYGPEDHASPFCSGNRKRCFDGIPACDDQLCGTGYAVQQHIHHGKPDRKLFLRLQLARRIHDRTDPSCHHHSLYASYPGNGR